MRKCFPEMTKDIESDSESDTFCVYSEQKEVLEKFALELKRVTEDLSTMERVWLEIRRAIRFMLRWSIHLLMKCFYRM